MTSLDPPDDALLRATADGSRTAFETLVRRHQAAVWSLVRRLAPSDALAEEALQEAFVAAFKGAGSWSGEGSVRSWLLTLARHACYRHVRRRAGEPARFQPLDELGAAAGWGTPTPDALFAALEDRERVERALGRLEPQDREVLVLRELLEYSGPETAEALGVSLAAMKSRLHRARLRFAAAVREEVRDA